MLIRTLRRALTLGAALSLAAEASLWHHVRVRQFLQSVYDQLPEHLPPALRRHEADLATSVLRLSFGRRDPTYQFRIRHKARLLELSAEVRETKGANANAANVFAEGLDELKALISPNIEIEEPSRTRTRLVEVIGLNPDLSQPISRSLTDEQATTAAEQMARLVAAVQSLLEERPAKRES